MARIIQTRASTRLYQPKTCEEEARDMSITVLERLEDLTRDGKIPEKFYLDAASVLKVVNIDRAEENIRIGIEVGIKMADARYKRDYELMLENLKLYRERICLLNKHHDSLELKIKELEEDRARHDRINKRSRVA
jgi:hypothetical protein